MRDQYQLELSEISSTLVTMSEAVSEAIHRATTALLDSHGEWPTKVVADDAKIDEFCRAAAAAMPATTRNPMKPAVGTARTVAAPTSGLTSAR
jgi:hypothetical protein